MKDLKVRDTLKTIRTAVVNTSPAWPWRCH